MGVGRDRLDDVPVLDDQPVLDAKDVHDRLAEVAGEHLEVVVEDHVVVLGDGSLEVERGFRGLVEEAADQRREDVGSVWCRGVVLGVGRAEVPFAGLLGVALDEGRVEEVEDDLLGVGGGVVARSGPVQVLLGQVG